MTFAEKLRVAMAIKGWTQSKLSNESGVAQTTISPLCLGKTEPKLSTAMRLAKALGVEITELLPDDEEEEQAAA